MSVPCTPPQSQSQPQPQPQLNDGVSGRNKVQLALEINSCRVIDVAKELALCAQSPDKIDRFRGLCFSLARDLDDLVDEALKYSTILQGSNCRSVLRGIDYSLAQNEVPAHISKLSPVLKMVCSRKSEFYLQPAIMMLMISIKNACKLNWFPTQDTEELLALADEVASNFVTRKDSSSEVCNFQPTVSTIISRYYPHFKLGNVLASFEFKPGYATHLVDFHIIKDLVIPKEEKIYLLMAMKDNLDTSSCIITPQEVNVLLNGNPVERRNRASMDSGPQLPTNVNRYLKYGINLLQVVGQFNGDYILIIALMSYNSSPSHLPIPKDYEQPVPTSTSSDSELIEGPSLVSINCPISKTRIRTPVKGHLCKHYQCFDFTTFVEMNFKRPSWRCPSCNQSVNFTDLRVDQKMVKALQEVGEKDTEVVYSIDGSFKPASTTKHKDELHNKASGNQLGRHELESMLDLTGEEDEMDTSDLSEPLDIKPVIHPSPQAQSQPSNNISLLPLPIILNSFPPGFNTNPQARISSMSAPLAGNFGVDPVSTNSFQGVNNTMSSTFSSNSNPLTLQVVQSALHSQGMMNNNTQIPRNIARVSSAIQALPVQAPNTRPHMPNISTHQHFRPTVSLPIASGPSFQAQHSSPYGTNVERQRHASQSNANHQQPSTALVSLQSRSLSPGVGQSTPIHNSYLSQTLSQPPHMRSQLPRIHNQHGVGPRVGITNSTPNNHQAFQRVQLMGSQQPSPIRPPHTTPLQTQPNVRLQSSPLPLSSGINSTPQTVSRTENLIDLQSEQNWRPRARMRGALSGPEYDALRSQLEATPTTQTPSPRLPMPLSRPSIDILLANRRLSSELQDQSGNGTLGGGSQG